MSKPNFPQTKTTAPSPFSLLVLCFFFLLEISRHAPEAVVTSSPSYYHSGLKLDFLCKSGSVPAYVRDVPWDCASFVVCLRGQAFLSQCPGDKLYSRSGRGSKCLPETHVNTSRCHGQLFNHIDDICRANPLARIPTPISCAHYVDCQGRQQQQQQRQQQQQQQHQQQQQQQQTGVGGSASSPAPGRTLPAGFMDGLLECAYPRLFSPASGNCEHHSFVRCRHVFEPKAPCDYLQYLQLYNCDSFNCTACQDHHPSCLTLEDGYYPVSGRPDVMMKCQTERTVDFVTCPPGFRFPLPGSQGKHFPRCLRI